MKHIRFTANARGKLVLIGGAEDRRNKKKVLKKLVSVSGAGSVAIIPSASGYPSDLIKDYYYAFKDLGVENIKGLDIRKKEDGSNPEFVEYVKTADVIFFTGGDQTRLVKVLHGTAVMKEVMKRFIDGATIAGTSAGAAAASDPMIFDGDGRGLVKGSIGHSTGFGFIKGITTDTHFNARNRLLRLSQFLVSGKSNKGIGLAEDTAMVIYPDMMAEICGSGTIVVVSSARIRYTNYNDIEDKDNINIGGINTSFLHDGLRFDLNKWQIVVNGHESKIAQEVQKPVYHNDKP